MGYRIYDKAMDNYRLGATVNENHGKLVATDEMIHAAMRKRTDQMRGVPLLKSVAGRIYKISAIRKCGIRKCYEQARKNTAFSSGKKMRKHPLI